MKTILYMAITTDGMIAKEDDDTSFVSDIEWAEFTRMVKESGNYVMGRRTFEVSVEANVFPYDCLNIVMTHKPIENKWGEKAIFTDKPPKEILKLLEEKGFSTAFIGGGSQVNSNFMKENLVDEVYLDVEPVIFGKGIPLFAPADFEAKLELIETKNLSKDLIQLHYRVER